MKKLIFLLVLLCGAIALVVVAPAQNSNLPELRTGDLIFQTSGSNQSAAILFATGSLFTHMGVIKKTGGNIVVVEAAGTVRETALSEWIERGRLNRVAVYRKQDLDDALAHKIVASMERYYGKPYDVFFSFSNDAIYCSELPFLAYREAGIQLGLVQRVSDLNVDNVLVKSLIKRRWKSHVPCRAEGLNFEQCYNQILSQQLITPVSIAEDSKLQLVFSNYPF